MRTLLEHPNVRARTWDARKWYGGGIMHLESHIKAFQAQWIIKYLDPRDSPWKNALDHWLSDDKLGRGILLQLQVTGQSCIQLKMVRGRGCAIQGRGCASVLDVALERAVLSRCGVERRVDELRAAQRPHAPVAPLLLLVEQRHQLGHVECEQPNAATKIMQTFSTRSLLLLCGSSDFFLQGTPSWSRPHPIWRRSRTDTCMHTSYDAPSEWRYCPVSAVMSKAASDCEPPKDSLPPCA